MPKTQRKTTAMMPNKRVKRKQPMQAQRGYQGIISGRLSPYKGEYRPQDQIIYAELNELVARAREMAQNDPVVVRYQKLLSANVIGNTGIGITPAATDPSGALDTKANDIISNCFQKWSKYPTVDNLMSWVDFQRICIENLVTDGEVFIRIYRGDGYGQFKYQLQMLSPDYVDVLYNLGAEGIRSSIQYDKYNRPINYIIYNRHPKDTLTTIPLQRLVIPANDVIHLYVQNHPDQHRGIPLIAPVMSQMLDAKHYKYLALTAARVGAGTQGFLTQTDPGKSKYRGNSDTEAAKIITTEPGSIQELPAGMDLKKYDPTYPIQGYSDYIKSISRDIASGLGVSYIDLYSDLNNCSYSSIRWGTLSDREQYKMFQRLLIDTVIEPIYLNFVEMACLSGTLTDGKTKLPYSKLDKYSQALYRPRSYPTIDPEKESRADMQMLQNQETTLTKLLAEKGFNIEDVLKERQRENELADKYGVDLKEIYTRVKTTVTGTMNNETENQTI